MEENFVKKITVFGATGMLGQPVVKELLEAGFNVTVMVRNLEKARKLLLENVKLLEGDLKNKLDIENALQDAEGIYLNLSVKQNSKENDFQPEGEGLENVLAVAKNSNIKRLAYCSSLVHRYQGMNGFDWWVFRLKEKAIKKIKSSGVPYTIFYPSTFMENFDKGEYMMGNRLLLAGESKYPMWFISGSDYGKQIARSFQISEAENRDYDVQGLEAFTADEAAKVFAENYQKAKLKISKAPLVILKIAGSIIQKINYGANILDALNNYPEKFNAETTWAELGKPTITLAEYAQRS